MTVTVSMTVPMTVTVSMTIMVPMTVSMTMTVPMAMAVPIMVTVLMALPMTMTVLDSVAPGNAASHSFTLLSSAPISFGVLVSDIRTDKKLLARGPFVGLLTSSFVPYGWYFLVTNRQANSGVVYEEKIG